MTDTSQRPFAPRVGREDERVVACQIGRRPRPMSAVVARCPYGFPATVEVLPAEASGRPFPTLYYLTCPTAVRAVSRLESSGGVERFQRGLDGDEELRASLEQAVRDTRERRVQLVRSYDLDPVDGGASIRTGIGGVTEVSRLKCLHAHAAHALAQPAYRLGAEVLAAAGDLWCDDRRCAAFVDARQGDDGSACAADGEVRRPIGHEEGA
jgi:hypothetical protein